MFCVGIDEIYSKHFHQHAGGEGGFQTTVNMCIHIQNKYMFTVKKKNQGVTIFL